MDISCWRTPSIHLCFPSSTVSIDTPKFQQLCIIIPADTLRDHYLVPVSLIRSLYLQITAAFPPDRDKSESSIPLPQTLCCNESRSHRRDKFQFFSVFCDWTVTELNILDECSASIRLPAAQTNSSNSFLGETLQCRHWTPILCRVPLAFPWSLRMGRVDSHQCPQ